MALDYAHAYQTFIDEELAAASATEWMAAKGGQVRFAGGKEVEIATLTTTGLGDYDGTKTDGGAYPTGAVQSDWNTYSLTMDRGVKFALDRTDPADTGFLATAENVIREFARVQLTREQDTYRINKLYQLAAQGEQAGKHVVTMNPASDSVLDKVCDLLQTLENDSEHSGGFVALINSSLKSAFLKATANTYHQVTFEESVEINGVRYDHVMMVSGLPSIFVPPRRMQTALEVRSGRNGQEQGGIVAASDSKTIYALLVAWDAPLAVSKIDSLKQFGPSENQLFDGTAIQARYLYDLFVPKNKQVAIGALVQA